MTRNPRDVAKWMLAIFVVAMIIAFIIFLAGMRLSLTVRNATGDSVSYYLIAGTHLVRNGGLASGEQFTVHISMTKDGYPVAGKVTVYLTTPLKLYTVSVDVVDGSQSRTIVIGG
jgi:hypothetical protein